MSCLYMRSLSATTAHKLSKKSTKGEKRRGDRVSETCAECLAECSACVRSVRAECVRGVRVRRDRDGMGWEMRSNPSRHSEGCDTAPGCARVLPGTALRHARSAAPLRCRPSVTRDGNGHGVSDPVGHGLSDPHRTWDVRQHETRMSDPGAGGVDALAVTKLATHTPH